MSNPGKVLTSLKLHKRKTATRDPSLLGEEVFFFLLEV